MKYAILAFGAVACATAFAPTEASAVVCARGVVRAGCAGPNGAVAVRKPVVVAPVAKQCTTVNGARVCR